MSISSMTCPIPKKLRDEMDADPWYHRCCLRHDDCAGRIQFHHHFTYAGKRQNVKFGILPVCGWLHERVSKPDVKRALDRIMEARATDEDRKRYERYPWSKSK
jgi:hypothetical protein